MRYFFPFLLVIASIPGKAQHAANKVDALLLQAEYDRVIEYIDQQAVGDAAGDFFYGNKKAEALIHLGKFEAAGTLLNRLKKNEEQYSPLERSVLLTNFGFLYLNQGRYDLALESLQHALQLLTQHQLENTLEAAQAMNFLGQVYKSTGKDRQAIEQMQMVLNIRQDKIKSEHPLIAAAYNDLGFVYSQIDNEKALDYYEKALGMYKKLYGTQHPKIAIASTNLGFIYRDEKLYGDAINHFETALNIWKNEHANPHPTKAFVLFNLGKTYLQMGNRQATRDYFREALDMYTRSYGDKHPDIATVLNAMGNLEIEAGRYNEALRLYQQALKANVSDFNNDDVSANPVLKNFYHGNVLLYSLLFKAEAFEQRHFRKTLKFNDLNLALQTLQRCDSLIDNLRQQISNENDKIALGVIANQVYADGVRIAYATAQVALHKKRYCELAFYFAEKSKSAVLQEAISDTEAKSYAGIPPALLDEEKSIRASIAMTAQKLAEKPDAAEERTLRETLFNLNRRYESFIHRLENEYPQYFDLKYNSTSPSIAELQRVLNDDAAVVSYFIDEHSHHLYIFLITQNRLRITERPLPETFNRHLTGLRNGILFLESKTYIRSASSLARILLPPNIPPSVKDLVILPAAKLSTLPFETLLTNKVDDGENRYASLPYLLKRFNIRYEFSAGLLLQKTKSRQKPAQPAVLLCAPVQFSGREPLQELPATRTEVQEIASLFAQKQYDQALLIGEQAAEERIKETDLKKYAFLHFATHGVVDEVEPERSRIFLQSASEREDGNLYTGEIYNLELNADLVTLSACETGLGKISKGEGVVGLSRALVYAGAKNIIVSFWKVADESTALLMKDFYRILLEQRTNPYSRNLWKAKLNLLKHLDYAAPYYWAPFIWIGY